MCPDVLTVVGPYQELDVATLNIQVQTKESQPVGMKMTHIDGR